MKLAIGLGLSSAAIGVLNSILFMIRDGMMMDSANYWRDEIEVIWGIQTFGLYPVQSALLLVFFIMFLRNFDKK